MDVYVLMFRDGDQLGCSQPMSKKEADEMAADAINNGYDVAAVCLNKMFDSERYIICPVKCK